MPKILPIAPPVALCPSAVVVFALNALLTVDPTPTPIWAGCPRSRGFETWEVRSPTPACLSQIETPKDNSCPMAAARIGPGLKHRETRGTRLTWGSLRPSRPRHQAPFPNGNTGFPTEPRNLRSIGCSESCFRHTPGFPNTTLGGVECHPLHPMRSMERF